jgi:hypothetical protein
LEGREQVPLRSKLSLPRQIIITPVDRGPMTEAQPEILLKTDTKTIVLERKPKLSPRPRSTIRLFSSLISTCRSANSSPGARGKILSNTKGDAANAGHQFGRADRNQRRERVLASVKYPPLSLLSRFQRLGRVAGRKVCRATGNVTSNDDAQRRRQ